MTCAQSIANRIAAHPPKRQWLGRFSGPLAAALLALAAIGMTTSNVQAQPDQLLSPLAAAPQPLWTLIPEAEVIPDDALRAQFLAFPQFSRLALGHNGTYLAQINGSIYVISGNTITPVLLLGQTSIPKPEGGSALYDGFTFMAGVGTSVALSPTRVVLDIREDLGFGFRNYTVLWDSGNLSIPFYGPFSLYGPGDANGKIVVVVNPGTLNAYAALSDGVNEIRRLQPLTIYGISKDGGVLYRDSDCRIFWEGGPDRVLESSCTFITDQFKVAVNARGDVLIGRVDPAENTRGLVSELLLYPASGGRRTAAEFGLAKPYVRDPAALNPLDVRTVLLSPDGLPLFRFGDFDQGTWYVGPNPATDRWRGGTLPEEFGCTADQATFDGRTTDTFGDDLKTSVQCPGQPFKGAIGICPVVDSGVALAEGLVRPLSVGECALPERTLTWVGEGVGNWTDEESWDPEGVPGSNDNVRFAQPGSFRIDLEGNREVASLEVTGPSLQVELDNSGDLKLFRELLVDAGARVILSDMEVDAGGAIIGYVDEPESSLLLTGFARLKAGTTTVGFVASGRIDLEQGSQLDTDALTIGLSTSGTVTVGSVSRLAATGQTIIGKDGRGSLTLGSTANFLTDGPVQIGGSGNSSDPFQAGEGGSVFVNRAAEWDALGRVTVGGSRKGILEIRGGRVELYDQLVIGANPNQPDTDQSALVRVTGPNDGGTGTGRLYLFGELSGIEVGKGGGKGLLIISGGVVDIDRGLLEVPGQGVGSRGLVFVEGGPDLEDTELRVANLDPNTPFFHCDVGGSGQGVVWISKGASWICPSVVVDGQGRAFIDGSRQVVNATKPSALEAKRVEVRSSGELVVQSGGEVRTLEFLVRVGGAVKGNGTVYALTSEIEGILEPGLFNVPLGELEPFAAPTGLRTMDFTPATISTLENGPSPSTLTLVGNVVLASSAVIELDVWGPGLADRLEVDGTLQINGATLVLNFLDGYLPSEGDLLDLIAATGGVTGSFGNVVFNGLGPGFEYRIDIVNGAVSLTALNDATEDDGSGGDGPGLNPPPVAIPTLSQLGLLLLALMLLLAGFRARGRSPRG